MSAGQSSGRVPGRSAAWLLAAALSFPALHAVPARAEHDEDWNSLAVVGVFPPAPLRSVSIHVTIHTAYGSDAAWDGVCTPLVDGTTMTYVEPGLFEVEFPQQPGGYRQSQAVFTCDYYTHEPNLGMAFEFDLVEATGIGDENVLGATAICLTQFDSDNPSGTVDSLWLCGDAGEDDSVDASDALAVLRSSVGARTCARARCDTDGDSSIEATDALRVLQFAVGRDVPLLCSACEP